LPTSEINNGENKEVQGCMPFSPKPLSLSKKPLDLKIFYITEKIHNKNIETTSFLTEEEIEKALEEKKFIFVFHGICNAEDEVVKYEALVRIKTDDNKLITPNLFLEVMKSMPEKDEKTVIQQMEEQTIPQLLKAMKQNPEMKFSINFEKEGFTEESIISLEKQLRENNINPKCLTIEMLESVKKTPDQNILNILNDTGMQLAIDDFGVDYSTIDRVRILDTYPNFSYVKFDGWIIKDLTSNKLQAKQNSMNVMKELVVELDRIIETEKRPMTVIAEFVKDEETFFALQETQKFINAEREKANKGPSQVQWLFQGYHFSEPVQNIKK